MEGGDEATNGGGEPSVGGSYDGSSLSSSGTTPFIGGIYGGFRTSRILLKNKESSLSRPTARGTDYSNPYIPNPQGATRVFQHIGALDRLAVQPGMDPLEEFSPQGRTIDRKPRKIVKSGPPINSNRLREKGLSAYRKEND